MSLTLEKSGILNSHNYIQVIRRRNHNNQQRRAFNHDPCIKQSHLNNFKSKFHQLKSSKSKNNNETKSNINSTNQVLSTSIFFIITKHTIIYYLLRNYSIRN